MAETKMTSAGKNHVAATAGGVVKQSAAKRLGLKLPTEVSEPVNDINEYHGVITGEPGIGKTTLGMQEPGVFLLTFDPYSKSLRALQEHCPDWDHFKGYLELLEESAKSKFPYRRVLVDGVDLWFRSCQTYICKKLVIDHPADEGWGKGWDALNQEFTQAVDRLMRLPCGIWFICHAREKEVEKRDGTKADKLRPVLTARAEEIVVGKCNFMINIYYIDGDKRVGTIRGSDTIAAKCNIDGHFLKKGTVKPIEMDSAFGKISAVGGEQVVDIVLGNKGPTEAYARLIKAFNNEQPYATYGEFKDMLTKQQKGATSK